MSVDTIADLHPERARACGELMAVLLQQEDACATLMELSARERAAVGDGRVDLLEQIIRQKTGMIDRVDQLEKSRQDASGRLARELGLSLSASLTDLVDRMDKREATDLSEVRTRVLDLAGRLQESNEANLLLMRKSLEVIGDSIKQLRRSAGGESYGSDGNPVLGLPSFTASVSVDCRA